MTSTDVLGWLASLCLLVTIGAQVTRQWRSNDATGVSVWLYVGQIAASLAFVVYSALVDNMVFIVTNAAMAMAAALGLYLYWRTTRGEAADAQRDTLPTPGPSIALATVSAEPASPRVLEEVTRDLLLEGAAPRTVDTSQLVVSAHDTIGGDPIHRHAD